MKTLEQIANEAGVTKAAIYKRFQSYGLSVNQLKAAKQGKSKLYGEDIERLIILMFQPEEEVEKKGTETEKETAETRAAAAEEKAAAAEEKAAAAEARAERAEAQAETLLHQVDKLTDAIRAAEAIQAAQLAKLPATTKEAKGGLFRRLRERLKGGKE